MESNIVIYKRKVSFVHKQRNTFLTLFKIDENFSVYSYKHKISMLHV